MFKFSIVGLFQICFCVIAQAQISDLQLLDTGWRFINADISTTSLSQLNDPSWEKVTVPHHVAVVQNFDMNIDIQKVQVVEDGEKTVKLRTGRTGALPCFGIGWYRKLLPITKADIGKRSFIKFDGAMSRTKVYLNDTYIDEWPYGYSSFSFELSRFIVFGKDNIINGKMVAVIEPALNVGEISLQVSGGLLPAQKITVNTTSINQRKNNYGGINGRVS